MNIYENGECNTNTSTRTNDPTKRKLLEFIEVSDPFTRKRVLKSFTKRKKNFDMFKEVNVETSVADKIEAMRGDLKESLILKLRNH